MRLSENWICDVCERTTTSEFFPKEWFEVTIESGSQYYGLGDNRNILKGCCSKECVRLAVEPLIEEE